MATIVLMRATIARTVLLLPLPTQTRKSRLITIMLISVLFLLCRR